MSRPALDAAAGDVVFDGALQYPPTPTVSLFLAGEATVLSDRSGSAAVSARLAY